jgi:hypothetical protein
VGVEVCRLFMHDYHILRCLQPFASTKPLSVAGSHSFSSPHFHADDHVLPTKIETVCRAHGFAANNETIYTRKVHDLVLLSTELDWLETQVSTVADYFDYFVILESTIVTSQPSIVADDLRPAPKRRRHDDHSGVRPLRQPRRRYLLGDAVVYLILALGEICMHSDPLPTDSPSIERSGTFSGLPGHIYEAESSSPS